MRYRLRTLLILLAILPPLLAGGWWRYSAWKAGHERAMLRRGDGRGWATIHGPEPPPGTVEVPIEQDNYWHHEAIIPPKQ